MENFAERLFCDLKSAGIEIENPQYIIEGAKITAGENSNQFFIMGANNKFVSGQGSGCAVLKCELTFAEAYSDFLSQIKDLGSHLKFYSLVVPRKAVIDAKLEEFEKVVSRYIKDYLPGDDILAERWDVIVQKLGK